MTASAGPLTLFKGDRAIQGDDDNIGAPHTEGDGGAAQVIVLELAVGEVLAPREVNDLAAAGEVARPAAGQVHSDVAQTVAGITAGGLEDYHIGDGHLFTAVAVYIGLSILLHPVEPAVGIVGKYTGFIVGDRDGDPRGLSAAGRGAILHKVHLTTVAVLVLQTEAVGGQTLDDGGPGGDDGVLQTVALAPLRVPPHQISVLAVAHVGAIDSVEGGDAPLADFGVGILAAAGVNVDGIVSQGQLQIVGAGGADGADFPNTVQGLVDGQHAGDAALGRYFVDHVSLGLTKLGKGLFQIVEHDGHRAAVDPFFAHRQAA